MCNQTEMYKEMMEYDARANKGEVHVRGIAHNPSTCGKCIGDRRKVSKKVKRTKSD